MNNVNNLNHRLIEASAGTGKTYKITELFFDYLRSEIVKNNLNFNLSEILIVTFTEKAAGELKERIRDKFTKIIADHNQKKESLEIQNKYYDYLNNFDSASIYTIHGFCNKLLKDYAFENNFYFNHELQSDKYLIDNLLFEILRNADKEYEHNLIDILDISGKDLNDVVLLVKDLCQKTNVPNYSIIPETCSFEELVENISNLRNGINIIIGKIKIITNDINVEKNIGKINGNSFAKVSLNINMFNNYDIQNQGIKQIYGLYKNIKELSKDDSKFNYFSEKIKKDYKSDQIFSNMNELDININKLLIFLNDKFADKYKFFIIIDFVNKLKKMLIEYKDKNNVISYDDMIKIVEKSIYDNKETAETIRKCYKYVIIDEFQDTDARQWNIFKLLFLNENNNLIVVGDPKQAIYGFRGGDIHVYEKAKNKINQKNNIDDKLTVNWRSEKNLVDNLTKLFNENNWFSEKEIITSKETFLQKTNDKSTDIPRITEDIKSCCINIIRLENSFSADKFNFAQKLVNQIIFLFNNNTKIYDKKINNERNIKFSDIAILVGKRSDSNIIEKELIKKGLPYTFYKKTGLYTSKEAENLFFLLNAINDDKESTFLKCLLTDFFRIPLNEIINYKTLKQNHKYRILIEKWKKLSENRKWNELFESIKIDTGIMLSNNFIEKEIDFDRMITNYEQIIDNLKNILKNEFLDLNGLIKKLKNLIYDSIEKEEDDDIHKIETEKEKINILTIHASKGLEFPFVFLFCNYAKDIKNVKYHKYYNKEIESHIYDLTLSNIDIFKKDDFEERKRLFYVALTRAVYKIYIPLFKKDIEKKVINDFGEFMCKSIINSFPENIENDNYQYIDEIDEKIEINKKYFLNERSDLRLPANLNELIEFPDNKIRLRYTHETSFSEIYRMNKDDNETYISGYDDFPGGVKTGNMFHEVFEKLDYTYLNITTNTNELMNCNVENKNYKILKENYYQYIIGDKWRKEEKYSIDKQLIIYQHEERFFNIIYNSLKTKILDNVSLSNINKENRLNEVKFYFPLNLSEKSKNLLSDFNDSDKEIRCIKKYITGAIDLIFKSPLDDKYYLLDWKSNNLPFYNGKDFIDYVKKHYEIQYKIYTIAIKRWFDTLNIDFKTHFGGILYLFIRGVNTVNSDGIFFIDNKNIDIDEYEKDFDNIL